MRVVKFLLSTLAQFFEYTIDVGRFARWGRSAITGDSLTRDQYELIILAHAVEKGLSNRQLRLGFGKGNIENILKLLDRHGVEGLGFSGGVAAGALSAYLSEHNERDFDLGSLRTRVESAIGGPTERRELGQGGVRDTIEAAPTENDTALLTRFLKGRHSVRHFRQERVSRSVVDAILDISRFAPSQCNRQSAHIFVYQDQGLIKELLTLQGGAEGFKSDVHNLFVVASDLSAWSGKGGRFQPHTDGALVGHQLGLACSALGLGSCYLNLACTNSTERLIRKSGGIPHRFRLIFMIAFGYPMDGRIPYSDRISSASISSFDTRIKDLDAA